MSIDNEQLKYRFKMTDKQFNVLTEEQQARCTTTDDDKKPYAVELFLSDADVDRELAEMSADKVKELAKKTHVGALQRAGREAIEIELGLKAKSQRYVEHDNKLYNEAKLGLDKLKASGVLNDSSYTAALDMLKETYKIEG